MEHATELTVMLGSRNNRMTWAPVKAPTPAKSDGKKQALAASKASGGRRSSQLKQAGAGFWVSF